MNMLMMYTVCANWVCRGMQIYVDRQVGKSIKTLVSSILIGRTVLGGP